MRPTRVLRSNRAVADIDKQNVGVNSPSNTKDDEEICLINSPPAPSTWTKIASKSNSVQSKKCTGKGKNKCVPPPVVNLSSDSDGMEVSSSGLRGREDVPAGAEKEQSDDEVVIEIVQLPTISQPQSSSNVVSMNMGSSDEYVDFYDPINDKFEDINDPWGSEELQRDGNDESDDATNNNNADVVVNSVPSPQPSTSRSSLRKKRPGCGGNANGSTPKRVHFASSGSEDGRKSDNQSDSDSNIVKRNKTKSRRVSSSSDTDNSDDSLFVPIQKKGGKKTTPTASPPKSSSSKSNESKHGKRKQKQGKTKRKPVKRKKVTEPVRSSSDTPSDSSEDEESSASSCKDSSEGNAKRVRRSKRSVMRSRNLAQKKKADAFELLRQKRERLANKPKRPSPSPERTRDSSAQSDSSSDSSYTSGPSPCPIVDNSTSEASDFDGSTPSSSSVTSSGVTDEEPDLDSGSEGEKDLVKEEPESDSGGYEDAKSCSSSSDEGSPDDGQNDPRCILCKNLGSANLEGRASRASTDNLDWCKCGECRIFSEEFGDYDLVCCQEIKQVVDFLEDELENSDVCVTKHSRFYPDVLKNEAYARSISKHSEARRFGSNSTANFWENYSCGKADYRAAENAMHSFNNSDRCGKMIKSLTSYLHWIFDQLGDEKDQMVIPACVQYRVRQKFRIPDEYFYPFQANYKCPIGRHCRSAQ